MFGLDSEEGECAVVGGACEFEYEEGEESHEEDVEVSDVDKRFQLIAWARFHLPPYIDVDNET